MIKINGTEYDFNRVAFDGCHKIYLLKDHEVKEAKRMGYDVYDVKELPAIYEDSCPLRFICTWDLTKMIIPQCYNEDVTFECNGMTATVEQDLVHTY